MYYFVLILQVEDSFFDRYDNDSDGSNNSDGEDSVSQRHAHTIKLLTDFIEDMNGYETIRLYNYITSLVYMGGVCYYTMGGVWCIY